ncbi:MAG TPA: TonB family protein [Bacteroidales bacterium]|nr:TonB family protein [Bacteroidales bacterium]
MNTFITYLFGSTVCAVVLYAVYGLFLRKETFFGLNRAYLLTVFILPLVLPLIPFEALFSRPVQPVAVLLDPVMVTPARVGRVISAHTGWIDIAAWVYLAGLAFFLARFATQILQMALMVLRYGIRRWNGFLVVFTDNRYAPFSFFGLLFLNRNTVPPGQMETILGHEGAHVRQFHSFDRVLAGVVTALQWFNPVVWVAAREMKSIHEFLADEAVLQNGISPSLYQQIILNETMGIRVNDLTNHFNVSLIKKRFTMMTKSRSRGLARTKVLLALPALVLLVVLFAARSYSYPGAIAGDSPVFLTEQGEQGNQPQDLKASEQAQKEKDLKQMQAEKAQKEKELQQVQAEKAQKQKELQQKQKEKAQHEKQKQQKFYVAPVVQDPPYTTVDKMPSFNGGEDARIKFMVENLKYPEEAIKKGIQGVVFVSFVVKADGSVASVKIVRGIGHGCDEEAFRVVKSMPKWIPGEMDGKPVDVIFNLPVKFKLDKDKKETPKK